MRLSKEQIEGLGIAFDEASLLGAELNEDKTKMGMTFSVLTLPSDMEPEPEDSRVSLVLDGVKRMALSLRKGRWDDEKAEVVKIAENKFFETIKENCGCPIYGADFFNSGDDSFNRWRNKLSLDVVKGDFSRSNTFDFFQAGRLHLDGRVWFDSLSILSPEHIEITLDDFIAGGKRWWAAFNNKDKRTLNKGMYPLE